MIKTIFKDKVWSLRVDMCYLLCFCFLLKFSLRLWEDNSVLIKDNGKSFSLKDGPEVLSTTYDHWRRTASRSGTGELSLIIRSLQIVILDIIEL